MTREDLEMVRNWRNSSAVSQFMYTNIQISAEDQVKWFNRIEQDPTCKYWIITAEDVPVGLVSFMGIDLVNRKCTWAFYIGAEEYLGSGIGARVEFMSLEYAFFELNLNKVACEVLTSNERVIQLHKKFGFQQEAFFKQHICKDRNFLDVVGLGLLKSEWETKRDYFINTLKFKPLDHGVQ